MPTFLGLALATPTDIRRRVTSAASTSWNGRPDEAERPDAHVHLLSAVEPDAFGATNLAGRIGAHMREHGSTGSFDEACPQHIGTLADSQAARTVRAKADAGARVVGASGDVGGLRAGRFVAFGASKRLYQVVAVDATARDITLDIPLASAVARGDAIRFSPTASWLWTPEAVANPPGYAGGVLAGVGWLLECVEEVA